MGLFDRLRRRAPALTVGEARELMDAGELLLVDVRLPAEFRAGHAEGARNVPLPEIEEWARARGAGGPPVAFICRSGMRSRAAIRAARRLGLKAEDVHGGLVAWERAGLPTERP